MRNSDCNRFEFGEFVVESCVYVYYCDGMDFYVIQGCVDMAEYAILCRFYVFKILILLLFLSVK